MECGGNSVKIEPTDTLKSLTVQNLFGTSAGYGFAVLGRAQCGDDNFVGGIYQKRHTGYNQTGRIAGRVRKTYYVLMRDNPTTNPNTEAQQTQRSKFADAVSAWQGLTNEQKANYNTRRNIGARSGYNIFISEYMKTH